MSLFVEHIGIHVSNLTLKRRKDSNVFIHRLCVTCSVVANRWKGCQDDH